MVKKETNKEPTSPLRQAKPKKLGLKVPALKMPHLELVAKPKIQELEIHESKDKIHRLPSQTTQGTQTSHTRQTSHTDGTNKHKTPLAPEKDFQKVPNSHTKIAIPEGLFKAGKSKHLYDVLYSLTRGAIEPKRSIRISKTKLMKLAGIGSRITFDSIITNFESIGLVRVTVFTGEHTGNEFEVLTYEETPSRHTSHTSQSSHTSHAQNLDGVVSLETSHTSQSSIVENKDSYQNPKTSFKDFKEVDDEKGSVFKDFIKKFEELAQKYTGKKYIQTDQKNWSKLADVLTLEFERAASRTKQISSVPAFLATHLERKFNKPSARDSKPQHIPVGKTGQETEPEVLSEEVRQTVLKNLREFVEDGKTEFVLNQKSNYAPEDWEWLMKNLQTNSIEKA